MAKLGLISASAKPGVKKKSYLDYFPLWGSKFAFACVFSLSSHQKCLRVSIFELSETTSGEQQLSLRNATASAIRHY